ncbi:uncharacterized protein LOC112553440 isoform X1 [Pomacea canaliculata]|uniref:uncharacterized protein LOC112553440 isoform X1 n=1 Tax=Pomacea canaliculata TaxID=400727 RepID=UPI000D72A0FB|nr:uncharacterized protein LOC112553440 isoform X1 [Pomacea canaliculata]XP_025076440.1 uncharacterized protein LOC112553440 isoform X1 [Pomacea canaliculata]
MARSLCLLVLMGCALHVVESRSRDARQVADDSTNLLPCKGAFVQFVGRTLIDDVRNLSLTIENDEAGSYLCIVKIKSHLEESSQSTRDAQVRPTVSCSEDEFNDLLRQCRDPTARGQSIVTRRDIQKKSLVYPGTVWCGDGNDANGDTTKLGKYNQTDSCCRAHDLCTPYIASWSKDAISGLFNWSLFTRLHCHCDNEFRDCLRHSTDGLAYIIGNMYFNILSSLCYDLVSRCPDSGFSSSCSSWKFISSGKF